MEMQKHFLLFILTSLANHFRLVLQVALLLQTSCFAICPCILFYFALLLWALCFALAFLFDLLARLSRYMLTKIFENNNCVSIDLKCF